jgi:predicted phage terminase large subunit-like protein
MSILGDRIRVPTLDELKTMSPDQRRELIKWSQPRLVEDFTPVIPHPPQQLFLWMRNLEAFYGGAGGGGKSIALLLAALQYSDVPGYNALILRRTYADLALPGALMDRARELLSDTPASPVDGGRAWVFPSGARLTFGYAQHYNEIYRYRSAELQYVAYDELTTFPERTYTFMFARLRRPAVPCMTCTRPLRKNIEGLWKHKKNPCRQARPDPRSVARFPPAPDGTTVFDVPLRMRSASNPGGIGHGWVRDRFVNPVTRDPKTVFVPARLSDNPSLDAETYTESLMHLDVVERERILNGDWEIIDGGKMFNRAWFPTVSQMPAEAARRMVRYWDLAATEDKPNTDPDWTAGALLGFHEGRWFLADIRRDRATPYGVEQLVARTAGQDGRRVGVWIEQEPGASGKSTIDDFRRKVLPGFECRGNPPSGSKAERARPMSSAAQVGNFVLVEGAWNRAFLDEAELFPTKGVHDDQIDACSGAMTVLTGRQARIRA